MVSEKEASEGLCLGLCLGHEIEAPLRVGAKAFVFRVNALLSYTQFRSRRFRIMVVGKGASQLLKARPTVECPWIYVPGRH